MKKKINEKLSKKFGLIIRKKEFGDFSQGYVHTTLITPYPTLINDPFPSARNPNFCCYKDKRDYLKFMERDFSFMRQKLPTDLRKKAKLFVPTQ